MQTVEKPNFLVVPQLLQQEFDGKRASFFTLASACGDIAMLILKTNGGEVWV